GHVAAGTDADQNTLFLGHATGPTEGFVVGHRLNAAEQARVEILGNESGANALDLVRPWLAAGNDRRVGRFDGNGAEIGLLRTNIAGGAGDRAARADAGDEDI